MRNVAIVGLVLGFALPGLRLDVVVAQSSSGAPAAAKGLQVRVADVVAPDYVSDADSNAPAGKPGPIRIVAARNGVHSGKVVVTSAAPMKDLSVQVGELKGSGGAIPATAVQVRYGLPWGSCVYPIQGRDPITYAARSGYLGLLAEKPLKEFPLGKIAVRRRGQNLFDTYGALVPVWVTVRVPAGAAPGAYAGQVTIRAEGEKPVTVPLEVKVTAWTAPDPAEWRTWADLMESPDTLAMEYSAELWSPRHWELIGHSFRYLREVGNRIVYVPLIAHTNMGNEQSMVRWVKKDGGGYTYDFTVLDQYLDTAVKEMGKPQIVVLYVWDNYMIRKGDAATGAAAAHEQQRILDQMEKEGGLMGKGPAVTVVDPKTKAVETVYMPHYTEAAAKDQWKPLWAELTQHLAKRSLDKAAMLGMLNDCWPTKAEVEFFKDLAPDMPWVLHAHFGRWDAYGLAKVGYRAQVWSLDGPKGAGLMGWKQPGLFARFQRNAEMGAAPIHAWRFWAEYCISGNQRGVARLGADYWPVLKDKQGVRKGAIWERYPESSWRNLGIYTSLLGPGEEGPLATPRLEVFREGLQECEARIVIETALCDEAAKGRLGADLAGRCQEAIGERMARMVENLGSRPGCRPGWAWSLGNDWQGRSEKLFTLAAEVAAKLSTR